jgi:TorA maturation chaperone TorD
MTPSDYAALAQDRSRFFWWLAEWFLTPPDATRLASLPQHEGHETTESSDMLDTAWQVLAAAGAGAGTLDVLGVEFTRLFSGLQEGMGPPPPFESVWREQRLVGETTVAVIDTYQSAGFAEIDPTAGPQDHIAVELKYLALLAVREAEAWQIGSAELARGRMEQQDSFLRQHPLTWVPGWADAIIAQSREPLFVALAGLVKAGLRQAEAELTELLRMAARK